jgi:hypothetical protein
MADVATSDYYQEMVQTNQELLAAGVTSIRLVNIEWGPITVPGGTATMTNWETWSTAYNDGTSEQSRDRNVYTLVQSNNTWKVQADEHPDAQAQSAVGAPVGPQPSSSGQPGGASVSHNWAGYQASSGTFTGVSGTWSVPDFSSDSSAGADATWVGIGGVSTNDLIQAGTQETTSGTGTTEYRAWVEAAATTAESLDLQGCALCAHGVSPSFRCMHHCAFVSSATFLSAT